MGWQGRGGIGLGKDGMGRRCHPLTSHCGSADPNLLMDLIHQEPCHVAALSQLQQIAVQTGQAELATELLERVLWAHEASYHPGFVQVAVLAPPIPFSPDPYSYPPI